MENTDKNYLDTLLQSIAQEQGEGFTYDQELITQEELHGEFKVSALAIKILTILGGLLASSTFLGFFLAAGLYDSPAALSVLGVMLLAGAEWLVRYKENASADALGVSLNIVGYILLLAGLNQLVQNDSVVAAILACVALLIISVSESAICVFLSVLVLNGSLFAIIVDKKELYNLAHGLVMLQAAILTYMSLHEAKLIASSPKYNTRFNPVRIGIALSLVFSLGLFVHQKVLSTHINYLWISGLFLIGCVLILLHRILKEAAITNTKTQVVFYTCCALVLAPTILTPSIPGALLVLLTSFYIGNKTGFWVGLLALVYFVIMYYYDLNMTLLAKSGVLVASGLLFLGGFVLLSKFLKSYAD